jgi:hypothetical protein
MFMCLNIFRTRRYILTWCCSLSSCYISKNVFKCHSYSNKLKRIIPITYFWNIELTKITIQNFCYKRWRLSHYEEFKLISYLCDEIYSIYYLLFKNMRRTHSTTDLTCVRTLSGFFVLFIMCCFICIFMFLYIFNIFVWSVKYGRMTFGSKIQMFIYICSTRLMAINREFASQKFEKLIDLWE